MKRTCKRFHVEVLKNFENGKKLWLVPFVSDDFKACVRRANWYRTKTNAGFYFGYSQEDLQNIRIFDIQTDTYINV